MQCTAHVAAGPRAAYGRMLRAGHPGATPAARVRRARSSARRRSDGFTLIEILVVVLIIGLLFGIAVLAINPNTREARLQREATRLWQLLSLVADEAVLQAREYGVRLGESGYAFYGFDGQAWAVVGNDKRLRERELPEFVQPEVEIEGLRVVLDATPSAAKPQIMLLSSGELIPDFAIRLRDRETDLAWRIAPTEDRGLALQRLD